MMTDPATSVRAPVSLSSRFQWLDSVRGLAIIWIAFFHFVLAYKGDYPLPITLSSFGSFVEGCAPTSLFGSFSCAIEGLIIGLFQRGAQGVGVFVLFSGFGLTYSLVRKGDLAPAWGKWFKRRFVRLFPIYWLAHLIFLVSPFQVHDAVDYRFILSLFGERVYPIDTAFYYFVPAWWFVGLLLQLYIVFPLLYYLMRRMGPARFLALAILVAAVSRYLIFSVLSADGNYLQGGFFGCRLWEFAAGMILGKLMAESPDRTLELLLSPVSFVAGVVLYTLAVLTYRPDFLFSFSDGFSGMGLSLIMIHLAAGIDRVPWLGKAFAAAGVYSYSIYLLHQPYVMYFGGVLTTFHIGAVLLVGAVAIMVVSVLSMWLERGVNGVVDRYVRH
ncbi:MAG: acyltransferase [Desulfobacteraceae bacterium]|nr:acyltransferase [Desulfobacteraceae bacterium]